MKERIKELAVEAGYVPVPNAEFANSLNEAFHQKFAELILEDVMQELFINGHTDAFDCLNEYLGVKA